MPETRNTVMNRKKQTPNKRETLKSSSCSFSIKDEESEAQIGQGGLCNGRGRTDPKSHDPYFSALRSITGCYHYVNKQILL